MLKKEIYSFYNTRQTGKDQLLYRIIKSDSSIDNTVKSITNQYNFYLLYLFSLYIIFQPYLLFIYCVYSDRWRSSWLADARTNQRTYALTASLLVLDGHSTDRQYHPGWFPTPSRPVLAGALQGSPCEWRARVTVRSSINSSLL